MMALKPPTGCFEPGSGRVGGQQGAALERGGLRGGGAAGEGGDREGERDQGGAVGHERIRPPPGPPEVTNR
jgi:hypothetical protein